MAISRDVLDVALPLPVELDGEDYLFLHDGWLAALAPLVGRVVVDLEPLTLYRQHDQQFTGMSMLDIRDGTFVPRSVSEGSWADLAIDHRRAILLADRVPTGSSSSHGSYLIDRQVFLARRLSMSLRAIASAVRDGQYRRHSRGGLTAAKDLVRLVRRSIVTLRRGR